MVARGYQVHGGIGVWRGGGEMNVVIKRQNWVFVMEIFTIMDISHTHTHKSAKSVGCIDADVLVAIVLQDVTIDGH